MKDTMRRLQKLEALRGLAAFSVLVQHYVHCNPDLASIQPFFVFGQVAVMLFFILSGFVIFYSIQSRDGQFSVRDYLVRRFRRIYPAFIIVMVFNWVLMNLLRTHKRPFDWWSFLGNLLMLQDKQHPNVWFEPFAGNSPLWSLSYEWWFYLLFLPVFLIFRAQPSRQKYVAAGITLLGLLTFWIIPNQFSIIAAYFMMWWAGVELARSYLDTGTITFRGQAFSFLIICLNVLFWAGALFWESQNGNPIVRGTFPAIQFQHYLTVLILMVLGIGWYRLGFVGFDATLGVFERLSPVSYVLYIIHLPIILFAKGLGLTGSGWLDFLWVFPVIWGISWLIEVPFQRLVNRLIR